MGIDVDSQNKGGKKAVDLAWDPEVEKLLKTAKDTKERLIKEAGER